ncbi:MAG: mycothiol system anti-sigma-R factor [Actinobacteria bacterium]|nr:mycothiol system anti-sigma-R factor [Actinomycetota bacterium]
MSHHHHRCDKAQALVYRYLDGEIIWFRRIRVRRHLRHCPPCEHGFHFEEWLKRRVHDGCYEEIPTPVYERLRAVLRELPVEGDTGG